MLPPSAFDREGFLCRLDDWSPAVAEQIAAGEQIVLTEAHWEVIHLLRQYYSEFDSSPAMRALVKYCGFKLGVDKGRSIYLLSLFPGSPARLGSKIAGLPKPANCL
ncbi:MAG: TusE/DsrC/DsvC family sulfur relay protein [Halioglobus sp.]|nr:TusE/DsrC/DsvC family sulfur relay protein [Halioglobus sp.]MCB1708101.1 TusE/DsrC/DsvC family sulfur relay protein [Halioglobus sp.]MCP5122213.1 TusE/DsrC/DsvC family sulfur relay protein [Pseudomonadales bacterium]MCP5192242.1 TusE/DsrC/DsvC family sulfur relay protein [Pseudomonadales bacterium]